MSTSHVADVLWSYYLTTVYYTTFQGSNGQLKVESHDFEKLSDELKEAMKTLSVLLNNRKEEQKRGYWTRMTKKINKAFFIFYITADIVFLIGMYYLWS